MWMWEAVYMQSTVTDYAKSFCGLGYKMQKSHNADQTKKKSFEYSVCLHLALTEQHFPCRNPPVKTQNGEAPFFFHYGSFH